MKNRKTALFRLIVTAVCAVLTAGLLLPVTASAETKSYSVSSAEFHVSFADNGDATVTEDWSVQYEKGSFTRFYKDIYNAFNQLEYISDVQVQSCKINGTEAILKILRANIRSTGFRQHPAKQSGMRSLI